MASGSSFFALGRHILAVDFGHTILCSAVVVELRRLVSYIMRFSSRFMNIWEPIEAFQIEFRALKVQFLPVGDKFFGSGGRTLCFRKSI